MNTNEYDIDFERSDELFKINNNNKGTSPSEDEAKQDKDIDLGVL